MRYCARILLIVLLAAFAAGTILESAAAAAMAAQMTLAKSGTMDGSGCDGCTDNGRNMPDCDFVCVAPVFAMSNAPGTPQPVAEVTAADAMVPGVAGRTGPPDPFPPRIIVLN